MDHTYLCPLPDNARFLWMAARTTAEDLFGYPDDDHKGGWLMHATLDAEFDHARAVLRRIIKDAPRVCLGQGYDVPAYMFGDEDDGKRRAHASTGALIELFWNAPVLTTGMYGGVLLHADLIGIPGRDPRPEIDQFLIEHIGQRIIPVRM